MKKRSAIFLFFLIISFSACDIFNLSVPDYIDNSLLLVKNSALVSINGREMYYETLKDAIASVPAGESAVISLFKDISSYNEAWMINAGKKITIISSIPESTITKVEQGVFFLIQDAGSELVLGDGLNVLKLNGFSDNSGPILYLDSNSHVIINDQVILSGNVIRDGDASAIYIHGNSVLDMTGGIIEGNSVMRGTVFVNGGIFNMSGNACMRNNTVTYNANTDNSGGGAVYINNSTFTMSGNASLYGNTVNYGGGSNNGGGAVYIYNSTFTMSGNASIRGNAAGNGTAGGGGVCINGSGSGGIFTMNENATVTGNTAAISGGGVYTILGTFNRNGCEVSGNTPNDY